MALPLTSTPRQMVQSLHVCLGIRHLFGYTFFIVTSMVSVANEAISLASAYKLFQQINQSMYDANSPREGMFVQVIILG